MTGSGPSLPLAVAIAYSGSPRSRQKRAAADMNQLPCLYSASRCAFSADEGADVGADEGTPVTETYKSPFKFIGPIVKVTAELRYKKSDLNSVAQTRKAAGLKKALSD